MSESPSDLADLSPVLGGARALPDEAPPPPPADAGAASADEAWSDVDTEALRSEIASLLGQEGAEMLQALGQIGTLGLGLSSLFTSTMQALETHLPETLAAFEGLVDAVGQAVDEVLESRSEPDEDARN